VYSRILKNFITESIKTSTENRQNTIQECAVSYYFNFFLSKCNTDLLLNIFISMFSTAKFDQKYLNNLLLCIL